MPKITVDVPHSLGQEKAVERLRERFRHLKDAFQDQINSFEEDWKDNAVDFRLATRGVTVTGTVTIDPSDVRVDALLPMVAMFLKGKIESRIRERLSEMLA